jgi:hypothetical protein
MANTNGSVAALRRALQQQLALGKRLVSLGEAQTDAIIAANIEQIMALEAEQAQTLLALEPLEQARAHAARELAWSLGFERVPSLSVLLPRLSERDQTALTGLRNQLLEVQRQMERIHARNRNLLEVALDYVQYSLELITSTALKPAAYGINLAHLAAPSFYIDSQA